MTDINILCVLVSLIEQACLVTEEFSFLWYRKPVVRLASLECFLLVATDACVVGCVLSTLLVTHGFMELLVRLRGRQIL